MRSTLILAALGAAFHVAAHAQAPVQVAFQHLDWELACDNTRTCRAAGYHAEEGGNLPMTVLLERAAGPDTPIVARLRLGDDGADSAPPPALAMQVDGRALGTLELADGVGTLSRRQAAALVAAVAGSGKAAWRAGGRTWRLSGKGASAVLLKMDAFQGRLGTRGAVMRKGGKPESGVLPALARPVVVAAAVPGGELPPLAGEQKRQLLATLRKTAGSEDCDDLEAIATGETDFAYAPLDRDRMLVSARCWRGAYNEGHGYWIVNREPPYSPRLATSKGTDYDGGTIGAAHRGRGIGDCGSRDEWVWDGRRFVHTLAATTGMCRGIAAGGGWTLPTLVSDVRR